ncbi:uncharacterized protein [Choristoneura fumiferana]|uniref:uncharacterized protein n=1 Tax=Choristoneura fumiferana TaxID=7141 RepID=UPI003D15D0BC
MWLLLTLVALAGCACAELDSTDVDASQRLIDVFGKPADGLEPVRANETQTRNGTGCICVPLYRCIVTNDSLLGADDNSTCPNVFDVCCPLGQLRPERAMPRAGCGWGGGARGALARLASASSPG